MNIGMKYPENATVPVGMSVFIIFWGKNHEVGVSSARVKGVLISAKVVSGIIDTENFMSVENILLNNNCVLFLDRKIKFIAIVLMS